jgi:hypothetical protein
VLVAAFAKFIAFVAHRLACLCNSTLGEAENGEESGIAISASVAADADVLGADGDVAMVGWKAAYDLCSSREMVKTWDL